MTPETLQALFKNHKENHLYHRYIHFEHIQPLIEKLQPHIKIETIGTSVLGKPISVIQIGFGPIKILMWSQMHGNETTTTKAIFDLCNVFAYENDTQLAISEGIKAGEEVIIEGNLNLSHDAKVEIIQE